jgi:Zn-dependent M28 family amino/carboxypeptidase
MKGDQIYNGADDDASGTSAVMEIAQAFKLAKQDGNGPKRSVLFINLTAEEKGLFGSMWYVEHPLFPLENTIADLNIDMVGRVDEAHLENPNFIYLIGSDKLSSDLHEISEQANKKYVNLDLDYTYNQEGDPNRFYYRSDHYNFAKNNIPVIFYFNGVHEDYHQPSDTADKIDFDLLQKRTELVFYTAWELANRDERPALN